MTVYEIPNINHCTVVEIGNPAIGYKITSNEGWYIHLNDGAEGNELIYKTVVILSATYDFSIVQILSAADLPADAIICGDVTEPPHEII